MEWEWFDELWLRLTGMEIEDIHMGVIRKE